MLDLLRSLGAEVGGEGAPTVRITCREVSSAEPDPQLVGRLRGSVLLLGALLGRTGRARLAPPGGDFPARRTITTHVQRARRDGRPRRRGPRRAPARGARRSSSGRRCTCSRRRSPARKPRCWPRRRQPAPPKSATRPASRTSPSCASSSRRWARMSRASARRRSGSSRAVSCAARRTRLRGDYIEAASWAVRRRDHARAKSK